MTNANQPAKVSKVFTARYSKGECSITGIAIQKGYEVCYVDGKLALAAHVPGTAAYEARCTPVEPEGPFIGQDGLHADECGCNACEFARRAVARMADEGDDCYDPDPGDDLYAAERAALRAAYNAGF